MGDEENGNGTRAERLAESMRDLEGFGFGGAVGIEYVDIGADRLTVRVDVDSHLHQPFGIVHGGVYCTIAEEVASIAGAIWFGDRGHVVGVNNSTDFLRAVRGGTLTAVGTPIHRGRTQQLWRVEISDENERMVAVGQVRLANIPAEQAG